MHLPDQPERDREVVVLEPSDAVLKRDYVVADLRMSSRFVSPVTAASKTSVTEAWVPSIRELETASRVMYAFTSKWGLGSNRRSLPACRVQHPLRRASGPCPR